VTPTNGKRHPIDQIQWVDRELLQANSWNPNHVAPPELELLKISILEDGWSTAIVVQAVYDGAALDHYEIIDGFHRWTVSGHPEIQRLTDGRVPVVVVTTDPAHARISTIRFNRARGTHAVTRMSDLIVELSEALDVPDEELMARLGMDHEEVRRLRERGRMVDRQANAALSEAWRPAPKVVPAQPVRK